MTVTSVDSSIHGLAQIFTYAALKYQDTLSSQDQLLLFLLSEIIYETTNLHSDFEGLYYYNIGVNFINVGEYQLAIEYLTKSKKIQVNLNDSQIQNLNSKIEHCKEKIELRDKIQAVDHVVDINLGINESIEYLKKVSDSIVLELVENGVLKDSQGNDIFKRALIND